MSKERLVVSSPCKINPTLEVLARRPDGMHEVSTMLLALDLCDRVTVERRGDQAGADEATGGIRLRLSGPARSADIPEDSTNLACRGARVALELARRRGAAGPASALELRVEKHIPSRAGLGGGSSNAAAAAFGVAGLFGIPVDDPELSAGLAALGADVPFFLQARATGWGLCTGRGERVRQLGPLGLHGLHGLHGSGRERVFVVLTPDVTCSTSAVYAALHPDELHAEARGTNLDFWASAPLEEAQRLFVNDLESAALNSHPELAAFRAELAAVAQSTGRTAGLTLSFVLAGSGSSYFGLFDSSSAAESFLASDGISRIDRDYGLRAAFVARPLGSGVGWATRTE